ncbi:hypothetical protein BKA70DRAFT_1093726 [Coprinopsis sp. MPI-PUGE-AT-0042]|nr:hypothetical protein BKA70DRAFT_1093726 [Coprinopsis sp. MPI-PUGE-AT-0042]
MPFFFTPHHVQLLNACYPPTSALLTSGPNYAPSSHELSRLTYYASNHPGKLNKIGTELERRIRVEAKKAKAGNLRSRASLLISLAIVRALAIECRRDIALIAPALIASVDISLEAIPQDLEVVARLASVFTAWTTYTNGHLVGADHTLTQSYLSILEQFADLACYVSKDAETQNRTRLIGFAALTGALNSEALYSDSGQFKPQVSIALRPILVSIFETDIGKLDDQATAVKNTPGSPYLAEFRNRPAMERRAASIHLHIDGEIGPSSRDVSDACLRALLSLFEHASGTQLGHIIQSAFKNIDLIDGWKDVDHCCWFAKKTVEWAQYQYRYVVPTRMVEELLGHQDVPAPSPLHLALVSMGEIINRINMLEVHAPEEGAPAQARASAICHLLTALQELIRVANKYDGPVVDGSSNPDVRTASPIPRIEVTKPDKVAGLALRRTRISPDIWQDTLSLVCDKDAQVRNTYASLLVEYLVEEMPKVGETVDEDGERRVNKLAEGSMLQVANINLFLSSGDSGSRFLNALHAYVYILAINTTPTSVTAAPPSEQGEANGDASLGHSSKPSPPRRSQSTSARPKAQKESMVKRLTQNPVSITPPLSGWGTDLANLQRILTAVHEHLPIRGLLTGAPMLVHLGSNIGDSSASEEALRMHQIVAQVWRTIGDMWKCTDMITLHLSSVHAVQLLSDCSHVQEALGMSKEEITRRLTLFWSPKIALYGLTEKQASAFEASVRGDNISPLLKISPALMQIENLSMQSLSTRALGVSDLREALEGKGGMSNPALARPPSVSTYDYTSSMTGGLSPMRPRSRARSVKKGRTNSSGDVKDVLSKIGIGKQEMNLLKAPLAKLGKPDN